jgi:hypothetical protein
MPRRIPHGHCRQGEHTGKWKEVRYIGQSCPCGANGTKGKPKRKAKNIAKHNKRMKNQYDGKDGANKNTISAKRKFIRVYFHICNQSPCCSWTSKQGKKEKGGRGDASHGGLSCESQGED